MGLPIFDKIYGKTQLCILMVGLDGAGKTTILNKLKLAEIIKTSGSTGSSISFRTLHIQWIFPSINS